MTAEIAPTVRMTDELSDAGLARRELLVAVGLCATTATLCGCGGGTAPTATPIPTPPPSAPPTPPPTSPPPPPVLDINPTVSFSDTQAAGLTTYDAYLTGASAPNSAFSYTGAASSLVTQFGKTFPRESMVSADISISDTLSPGALYATFYHTGSALDLIQYGFSDTVTLYIT